MTERELQAEKAYRVNERLGILCGSMKPVGSGSNAAVSRDGYQVPLIGIPVEAVLETCDCCGDTIGLSDATFTGRQVLCRKCNTPNAKLSEHLAQRPARSRFAGANGWSVRPESCETSIKEGKNK